MCSSVTNKRLKTVRCEEFKRGWGGGRVEGQGNLKGLGSRLRPEQRKGATLAHLQGSK